MESPYYFIIKPLGGEYSNEIEIAGKSIIINSTVENHKHVNRFAKVIHVPKRNKTGVSVGDIIVVHHNVFRIYYDVKGNPKKSPNYFKDDLYFIDESQFYLYSDGGEWRSVGDFCFIKPIDKENTYLYEDGFEENTGFVTYCNEGLESLGVFSGDKINFRKDREYEFNIDDQLLYRMKTNDICVVYD